MKKRGIIDTILLGYMLALILVSANVFVDKTSSDFSQGSHSFTFYNSSGFIQLNSSLTGSYASRVFDAGNAVRWNNLTWEFSLPYSDLLFAVDYQRDVWKSVNSGITWSLINDTYGAGIPDDMAVNSSGSLFILTNQDLWSSINNGVSWTKINDDINGAGDSNSGLILEIDSNNYLYIIDASEDVFKSTNSGVNFTKVNGTDFNNGNGNVYGMAIDSSNILFAVDYQRDVWKSVNNGVSWSLINDTYGAGIPDDMAVNSSGSLFILTNQDLWSSINNGVSWTKINDDINGAGDSNSGLILEIDSNNYLYIIDASEDVFKSTNSGVNFTKVNGTDFNNGNGNVYGMAYFRGYSNLTLQVKNCSLFNCNDGIWQSLGSNFNVTGRYFQYLVNFTSPDTSISPLLFNVSINYDILNRAPIISLASPQNGASYGYNTSINLNYSAVDNDNNLQSCWYNLDNGLNISLVNCQNTSFNASNGNHILRIFANDSLGLIANDTVSFSINVGAPTIILYSPISVYLNFGNVSFSYVPSDIDLASCELWGNFDGEFKLNQTDSSSRNGWINYFYLNLSDGNYLWNIRCNDSQGHSAFNGNKTFYIDTITPGISVIEPVGKKTTRTDIPLSFNASDTNIQSCWYNIYRGVNLEIQNTSLNCNGLSSFNVTLDADFVLNIYANDSAGNINYASSSFSVDTSTLVIPSSGGGGGGGGGSSSSTIIKKGELEISNIGNMVVREGDKKTLLLNAKNTGKIFLNNCRLIFISEISSWFYSNQIDGIAPGENKNFIFDLNVPEGAEKKDYSGEIEVNCDETSQSSSFTISIPGNPAGIEIKEIKQEKNNLKINYVINSEIETSIDIWLIDKDGKEIKRIKDDGKGERNVVMELESGLIGIYSIYFAPSSNLDNFVKQSIVLGKSSTTGFTIFDEPGNKLIGYIVFVLIICIAVFFIVRSKNNEIHSMKHRSLFSKKEF